MPQKPTNRAKLRSAIMNLPALPGPKLPEELDPQYNYIEQALRAQNLRQKMEGSVQNLRFLPEIPFLGPDYSSNPEINDIDIAGKVPVGPLGKKNAKAIWDAVEKQRELLPEYLKKSRLFNMLLYAKEKYPKFMGFIEDSKQVFPKDISSTHGSYGPIEDKFTVADAGTLQSINEYLDTILHETTHAGQWKRQKRYKEMLNKDWEFLNNFTGEKLVGQYEPSSIHPSHFQKLGITDPEIIKAMQREQFQKYLDQPVEVQARRAGATAANTFEKFKEALIPEEKILDLATPLTKENYESTLKPILEDYLISDIKRYPGNEDWRKTVQRSYDINKKIAERYLTNPYPNERKTYLDFLLGSLGRGQMRKMGYTKARSRFGDENLINIKDILGID